MSNSAALSIVIPVYNAKEYLARCVESILGQTYLNWELLLIDDGSTDGSSVLCDALAKRDARIRVYHKPNGGASSARNLGLDKAAGQYITFVDADDWLGKNYCEHFMATDDVCQLVIGGAIFVNKHSSNVRAVEKKMLVSLAELKAQYQKFLGYGILNGPWAKRYQRDIIGGQRFDEAVGLGEDYLFNLAYMKKCENIAFLPCADYYYNQTNESAATNRLRDKDFEHNVRIYREAKAFFAVPEGKIDLLDREFYLITHGLIQKLCYSGEFHAALLREWLGNENVRRASKGKYDMPARLVPAHILCRMRSAMGIQIYYRLLRGAGSIKRTIAGIRRGSV